jgi:glutathione S-transferase
MTTRSGRRGYGGAVIRLYRAPYSTNCQRVTLALAHKGLEFESVWIDYSDRSPVERVSGQGLVPVIDDDGTVVPDSTRIISHLEERTPEPALYPADPARRAEVEVFIDWFNHVWKGWANGLEEQSERPEPDATRVHELSSALDTALDHFEVMLHGRDFVMGESLAAADLIVYPFAKYAAGRDPADDELFHRLLDEHQSLEARPRLEAWIRRVGERPGTLMTPE